jgi:hypothetical protein
MLVRAEQSSTTFAVPLSPNDIIYLSPGTCSQAGFVVDSFVWDILLAFPEAKALSRSRAVEAVRHALRLFPPSSGRLRQSQNAPSGYEIDCGDQGMYVSFADHTIQSETQSPLSMFDDQVWEGETTFIDRVNGKNLLLDEPMLRIKFTTIYRQTHDVTTSSPSATADASSPPQIGIVVALSFAHVLCDTKAAHKLLVVICEYLSVNPAPFHSPILERDIWFLSGQGTLKPLHLKQHSSVLSFFQFLLDSASRTFLHGMNSKSSRAVATTQSSSATNGSSKAMLTFVVHLQSLKDIRTRVNQYLQNTPHLAATFLKNGKNVKPQVSVDEIVVALVVLHLHKVGATVKSALFVREYRYLLSQRNLFGNHEAPLLASFDISNDKKYLQVDDVAVIADQCCRIRSINNTFDLQKVLAWSEKLPLSAGNCSGAPMLFLTHSCDPNPSPPIIHGIISSFVKSFDLNSLFLSEHSRSAAEYVTSVRLSSATFSQITNTLASSTRSCDTWYSHFLPTLNGISGTIIADSGVIDLMRESLAKVPTLKFTHLSSEPVRHTTHTHAHTHTHTHKFPTFNNKDSHSRMVFRSIRALE